MSEKQKLIKWALGELGYLEKSLAAYYDDPAVIFEKTKGAGSDNVTKYGLLLKDALPETGDTFGLNYQWCGQFVEYGFLSCFGKDRAKKLLGGWSAYTPLMADYFQDMGRYSQDPEPGAVIFFKNNVRICHTGIVIAVYGNSLETVEGNTGSGAGVIENGGCVARKTYLKSNTRIAGYGLPKWEVDELPTDEEIRDLYVNILYRTASDEEVNAWRDACSREGLGVEGLARMIANSLEARREWVRLLYGKYLHRAAEETEVNAWVDAMIRGETRGQVLQGIADSEEAKGENEE